MSENFFIIVRNRGHIWFHRKGKIFMTINLQKEHFELFESLFKHIILFESFMIFWKLLRVIQKFGASSEIFWAFLSFYESFSEIFQSSLSFLRAYSSWLSFLCFWKKLLRVFFKVFWVFKSFLSLISFLRAFRAFLSF